MLQYDENLATEPQPLSLFTVATWLNPLILNMYINILPDWTPKHFLKGLNLENLIKEESTFPVMNILLINIICSIGYVLLSGENWCWSALEFN